MILIFNLSHDRQSSPSRSRPVLSIRGPQSQPRLVPRICALNGPPEFCSVPVIVKLAAVLIPSGSLGGSISVNAPLQTIPKKSNIKPQAPRANSTENGLSILSSVNNPQLLSLELQKTHSIQVNCLSLCLPHLQLTGYLSAIIALTYFKISCACLSSQLTTLVRTARPRCCFDKMKK